VAVARLLQLDQLVVVVVIVVVVVVEVVVVVVRGHRQPLPVI
jgi:hypothetical protein